MTQRGKSSRKVGITLADTHLFMLLLKFLQEKLKRSKKAGKKSSRLSSLYYEIISRSLRGKMMEAELVSMKNRQDHDKLQEDSGGTTAVGPPEESSLESATQQHNTPITTSTNTISRQESSIKNSTEERSSPVHPTLRDRNALMFNNELMSDVHFVVGPPGETVRVPAHKYVLAVGSSVFCAMFYGELAESQSDIRIPDVEPRAFLALLRYLYCDELDLSPDLVLSVLYAAKKYLVGALASACVCFLEAGLEASNACLLLSHSQLFHEAGLSQRCWEMIDAQAELALQSEAFCQLDPPTLEQLLRRDSLVVSGEGSVFRALIRWAEAECARQGRGQSTQDQREVLGSALSLVRLASLSLQEFADGPAQCGLLTPQETNQMFLWYTAAAKPHPPFPSCPRTGLRPRRCCRFQAAAQRANQWRYYGNRCDSIQFSADRRLFLAGVGLYGASGTHARYAVHLTLKRNAHTLAHTHTHFLCDGSSAPVPVMLEHPVLVEPNAFYTVSAVLEGSELSYFGQEGLTEVSSGPITFHFQCSAESTNGTGVQGGQIPELIYYCCS